MNSSNKNVLSLLLLFALITSSIPVAASPETTGGTGTGGTAGGTAGDTGGDDTGGNPTDENSPQARANQLIESIRGGDGEGDFDQINQDLQELLKSNPDTFNQVAKLLQDSGHEGLVNLGKEMQTAFDVRGTADEGKA